MRRILAAFLFLMLCLPALAADNAKAVVEKWYAALALADSAAFEDMIANDAVITLNDLQTVQNKREFIDSLDEWQDAARGASIRHRIETEGPGAVSVLVCYTFPGNEMLNRETFRVAGGKVMESVQTAVSGSCAQF